MLSGSGPACQTSPLSSEAPQTQAAWFQCLKAAVGPPRAWAPLLQGQLSGRAVSSEKPQAPGWSWSSWEETGGGRGLGELGQQFCGREKSCTGPCGDRDQAAGEGAPVPHAQCLVPGASPVGSGCSWHGCQGLAIRLPLYRRETKVLGLERSRILQ